MPPTSRRPPGCAWWSASASCASPSAWARGWPRRPAARACATCACAAHRRGRPRPRARRGGRDRAARRAARDGAGRRAAPRLRAPLGALPAPAAHVHGRPDAELRGDLGGDGHAGRRDRADAPCAASTACATTARWPPRPPTRARAPDAAHRTSRFARGRRPPRGPLRRAARGVRRRPAAPNVRRGRARRVHLAPHRRGAGRAAGATRRSPTEPLAGIRGAAGRCARSRSAPATSRSSSTSRATVSGAA